MRPWAIHINLAGEKLLAGEVRTVLIPGETSSVSEFIEHAVHMALNDGAEWQETLADALEQTGGPLTPEERAWADSILSPAPRKPRPRRRKRA